MRADEPVTNANLWEVFAPYLDEGDGDGFDLEAIVFWMEWI